MRCPQSSLKRKQLQHILDFIYHLTTVAMRLHVTTVHYLSVPIAAVKIYVLNKM